MPIYYLYSRPETVVSLVRTGKLPTQLPHWAQVDYIYCRKNIADCFTGNTAPPHQVFILALEFLVTPKSSKDCIILSAFDTACLRQIFVYSLTGSKLLQRLLQGNCPIPITIQPDIYTLAFFKTPEQKAQPIQAIHPLPFFAPNTNVASKADELNKIEIKRLTTYEDHFQLLRSAFLQAKSTILLTSFGITHETLKHAQLYDLIPQAAARGVRIYVYYNDQQIIDANILRFLKNHGAFLAATFTHSKILAVDKRLMAAGSFNWLSALNPYYGQNDEGSLYVKGEEICGVFIEELDLPRLNRHSSLR